MSVYFFGYFLVANKKKIIGANWMGYCPNYIVRGENSSKLGYCILGVAGKLLEVLKKKNNLCKVETGLEEFLSRHPFGVATWLRLGLKGPRSRHEIHVVTWGKQFEVAT